MFVLCMHMVCLTRLITQLVAQDNVPYSVEFYVAVYRSIKHGKIHENPGRKRKRKEENFYYFSSKLRCYTLLPLCDKVMYLLAVAVLFL